MRAAPTLVLITLTLTGCYEFSGELGRIGFLSNLQLSSGEAWTPASPVAAGAFAEIAASERLTGSSDPEQPLDVQGATGAGLIAAMPAADGAHVAFTGEHRDEGVVRFWGEVDDHFRVRFVRADRAALVHPSDHLLGLPPADEVALVAGADVVVDVTLLGADGAALGWPREDLVVVGQGGVSAWQEGGELHLVADADGSVFLSADGIGAWSVPVMAVSAQEITTATLEPFSVGASTAAMAVGWLDAETRVLGAAVSWPHTAVGSDTVEIVGDGSELWEVAVVEGQIMVR